MKVLLIDKNLTIRTNLLKWELLAEKNGIELIGVTPEKWIENYRTITLNHKATFPIYPLKVVWPGYENRSFYLKGFGNTIRKLQADVVIVFEEPFSLFALQSVIWVKLFSPESKIIFHTWDNLSKGKDYSYRPRVLYKMIERFSMRHSAGLIAANQEAADYFSQLYETVVKKIYFGIDLVSYRGYYAKNSITEADKTIFIGYIGRIVRSKGVETLVRAMNLIENTIHLLIVGNGPDLNAIKELVKSIGLTDRVRFYPAVSADEVAKYLSMLRVLVLPSRTTDTWKEQYGRILVEAMACGIPVVGSSSGAIPEVIDEAGLIFPEGDESVLAAHIQKIILNPELWEQYSKAGRCRAEKFSASEFADSVFKFITEQVSG
jgi:glycosyltransferase involved in cell wall biosynthesis